MNDQIPERAAIDITNVWNFEEKLDAYRIHLHQPSMRGCYILEKKGHIVDVQFDDGSIESVPALSLRREDQIQW